MIKILQHPFDDIVGNHPIDFLIVASGYESRCVFQAKKLFKQSTKKFALGFKGEQNDSNRIKHDEDLSNLNFESLLIDAEESPSELESIIDKIDNYAASKKDSTVVYIDYSSMTRNWYSYLLLRLTSCPNSQSLRLYFGYSHAEYVKSTRSSTLNRIVSPLFGYCDLCIPSKPTALIIGLGNEPERIYGLKEYFDAAPYLFYSDTSYNEQYSSEVEELNQEIINELNKNHVFKFPVHDLLFTYHLIESLCRSLMKYYRIVIASCGPKPFSLVSMIASLNYSDSIEAWRISAGLKTNKVDRTPTGLVSLVELKFVEDISE